MAPQRATLFVLFRDGDLKGWLALVTTLVALSLCSGSVGATEAATSEARVSLPAVIRQAAFIVWGTVRPSNGSRQPAEVEIQSKLTFGVKRSDAGSFPSGFVLTQLDSTGVHVTKGEELLLFLIPSRKIGEFETAFGRNGHFRVSTVPCPGEPQLTCRVARNGFENDGLWRSSLWQSLAGGAGAEQKRVLEERRRFEQHLKTVDLKAFGFPGDATVRTRVRLMSVGDAPAPERVPLELLLAAASYSGKVHSHSPGMPGH